jgi:hypothetical protein
MLGAVAIALALSMFTTSAHAQLDLKELASRPDACPSSISNAKVKETKTDDVYELPLEQPLLVRYGDNYYKIPMGYLRPSPLVNKTIDYYDPERIYQPAQLNISFWMPDLRYPERTPTQKTGNRLCEKGRQKPTSAYVVNIELELFENNKIANRPPEQKVKNDPSLAKRNSNNIKEVYGLIHPFRPASKSAPHDEAIKSLNAAMQVYYSEQGQSPQIYFSCSPVFSFYCGGAVYYPDTKTSFTLFFEQEDLQHWKSMVDGFQTLLESWKVKDNNEVKKLSKQYEQQEKRKAEK